MRTIHCTSARQKVICATNVNGQTCDGDSGSAVVGELENSSYLTKFSSQVGICLTADRDNNGIWVLYGIASYGYGSCGYSGGYSGFTDVSEWSELLLYIAESSSNAKSHHDVLKLITVEV